MSKTETSPSNTDAAAPVSATPATAKGPDSNGQQDKTKVDLATAAIKSAGKGVWAGAAVGIGSAAIVAALLYTRRKG